MIIQPGANNDPDDAIIHVRALAAGYGAVRVVEELSFSVRRAEVFVIAGASGSGKSTVLMSMIGLLPPIAGSVLIDGDDITGAQGDERRRILRRFGVTYQSGALFGSMTLLENVLLPIQELTDLDAEVARAIARGRLALVGLDESADLLPDQVSGGMRKRAAIARAMALDPSILFLDEPSAGLDPTTGADIDRLILDLAAMLRVTFVIVTHELSSIFAIADRVLVLDPAARSAAALGSPRWLRDECPIDWVRAFFRRSGTREMAEATS